MNPQRLLLTIDEAATELRVSQGYVKKEIRAGRLNIRKIGRLTRVERRELEAWIQRQPTKSEGTATDHGWSPTENEVQKVIEKIAGDLQ